MLEKTFHSRHGCLQGREFNAQDLGLTTLVAGLIAASAAQADITVGFVTSLSGNGSSIGIPYARGIAAAVEYRSEVNGEKIRLINSTTAPIRGRDPQRTQLVEEERSTC